MCSGYQIDICSILFLQFQEYFCQSFLSDLKATVTNGNFPVLAETASQIASCKKDCPGTSGSRNTWFFRLFCLHGNFSDINCNLPVCSFLYHASEFYLCFLLSVFYLPSLFSSVLFSFPDLISVNHPLQTFPTVCLYHNRSVLSQLQADC